MRRLHRWMSTAAGVITLAVAVELVTWIFLGGFAALQLAGLLAALGLLDISYRHLFGSVTFSETVNARYHEARWRYYAWVVIVAALLFLGLHAHFTGV